MLTKDTLSFLYLCYTTLLLRFRKLMSRLFNPFKKRATLFSRLKKMSVTLIELSRSRRYLLWFRTATYVSHRDLYFIYKFTIQFCCWYNIALLLIESTMYRWDNYLDDKTNVVLPVKNLFFRNRHGKWHCIKSKNWMGINTVSVTLLSTVTVWIKL